MTTTTPHTEEHHMGEPEPMDRFVPAFNTAMQKSKGRFSEAAAILADAMEFHEELRVEAALLLIASTLQPGRSELERALEADTGMTLDGFVSKFLPAALNGPSSAR